MKTLPAFKNYEITSFMIDLTGDYVKSYKIDVAWDVRALYKLIINGKNQVFWGIRECGTGMGYADSEYLDFYKKNNMIILFEFSNFRIVNGEIYGDIAMIDYNEDYENKWYNEENKKQNWFHAGDEYDDFYYEVRTIVRKFIKNHDD